MKVCRNCRRENPDDATFCISCGFSLDWGGGAATTIVDQPPTVEPVMEALDPKVVPEPTFPQATVHVALASPRLLGRAGAATGCEVRIRNLADSAEAYQLALAGTAAGFGEIYPNPVLVESGEETRALLTFRFPQTQNAGSLDFELGAVADGHPEIAATTGGTVEVRGRADRALLGALGLGALVAVVIVVAISHWGVIFVALLIAASVAFWRWRRSSR